MDNEEKILAMLERIQQGQAQTNERLDRIEDRLVRVEVTQENIVIPQIRAIAETHGDVIKGFKRLDTFNEKLEDIQNTVDVLKLVVAKK